MFDIGLLTRELEHLYLRMAEDYARRGAPRPSLANLDAYLAIGAAFDHDEEEIGLREDYHDLYRARLATRHGNRAMVADCRLWDQEASAHASRPAASTQTRNRVA